jgi:riboflavin kinase/FMN adenylyltransferase
MILIRNLNQINHQLPKLALTIGNFDGVHLAHQKIIEKTQEIAKKNNLYSALLSFEPHPISFLNKNKNDFNADFRITNLANKINLLKKYSLDYLIILPFNNNLSSIKANNFIEEILINKFNVKSLIIGYDFTFGKGREGNFKTLENYNFDLHEINPIKILDKNRNEITISSSLARQYLKNGEIISLNKILGHNFAIDGIVVEGKKIAGELGYKTANINHKINLIKPKFGVYKTRTFIYNENKFYDSITNFGIKPTFDNSGLKPLFETHLLNFSKNLYHKKIRVEFLDFIRDEKKFSSIDELKNQIKFDINLINKN